MRTYTLAKRVVTKKRSDGSIYKWESPTFFLSYYKNRKKVFENTNFTNEDEAKQWAEERMKRVDGETLRDFLENNNWFSDTRNPLYLDANSDPKKIKYNYLYGQSQRNTRYLEIIIKDIKDPIGDVPYNTLDRREADKFRDRLLDMEFYTDKKGKTRKVTTTFRNRVILSLSVIFNYYIKYKREYFLYNPFEKFAIPDSKKTQKSKFVFSPKQIRYMFNESLLEKMTPMSLVNDYKGKISVLSEDRWHSLIHSIYFRLFKFIAYTGLRGNEACSLTVGQFDKNQACRVVYIDRAYKSGVTPVYAKKKKGEITVVGDPKSGKARTIVLCDEAYFAVADLLEDRDDDTLVFSPYQFGKELEDSLFSNTKNYNFRIFINEIKEQFHIQTKDNEELTLHGFRTSLNSNLINRSSLRESLIAAYLGWTSKTLTNTQRIHYTHYDIDHLWEVASTINDMYSGTPIRWTPSKEEQDDLELDNIVAQIEQDDSEIVPKRIFRKVLVQLYSDIANMRHKEVVDERAEYYGRIRDAKWKAQREAFLREHPEKLFEKPEIIEDPDDEFSDLFGDLDPDAEYTVENDPYNFKYTEADIKYLLSKPIEELSPFDYANMLQSDSICFLLKQRPDLETEFLSIDNYWHVFEEDDPEDLS